MLYWLCFWDELLAQACQHECPVSSLESTLIELPVSVDSKEFVESLSPLDATFTKNRGEGRLGEAWLTRATIGKQLRQVLRALRGVRAATSEASHLHASYPDGSSFRCGLHTVATREFVGWNPTRSIPRFASSFFMNCSHTKPVR